MGAPYYTHTNLLPKDSTRALAGEVRDELDKIAQSFDLLPLPAALIGGTLNYAVATGPANAYAVTLGSTVTAYVDGLTLRFKAAAANTSASTLNVNGLGLRGILRPDGTTLAPNDIFAGSIVQVSYDATAGAFQLALSPVAAINAALGYAAAASGSASGAASSAGAASSSAAAASGSAALAAQWAMGVGAIDGTIYGSARSYAIAAFTSANDAGTALANAIIARDQARDARDAAAESALQAGAPLTGASSTSLGLNLSPASKTLTTQLGKAWTPGQMVVLARTSAPVTQRMSGTITAYDPATGSMTVLIAEFTGSGTFTDWTIGVTGPRGASSLTLPVLPVVANLTGVSNVIYGLTAAVTVTMPAAPTDGDFFGFSNRSGGQPSVNPNGKTIKGVAGTLILDSPAASALLRYDAATNDWVESFQGFTVASISSNAVFVQPNTWTGKQTFQGFTVLGDASVKVKVFSGTTAAAQGGDTVLTHGVDAAKIVSITAVANVSGNYFPSEYTASAGNQFSLLAGATGVVVRNHPTNSSGVLSKPVFVTIIYTE